MTLTDLMEIQIPIGRNSTLHDLCSAIFMLVACILGVRLVMKIIRSLTSNSPLNYKMRKYINNAIELLLYFVVFIIFAQSLNINMTSMVALLSVGSLGITLAAEGVLGNAAGSLVILYTKPFVIGDYVEVNGAEGTVDDIDLNYTRLITLDGHLVLLPNKDLLSMKITNFSARGCRRVTRVITASYDASTKDVRRACMNAIHRTHNVLSDPEPVVYLTSYLESSIEYTVHCWVKPEDYIDASMELNELLRMTFMESNVEISYNHLNLHIVEDRTR